MLKANLNLLEEISSARVWRSWLVICAFTFVVHCFTLRISPTVWQDEVQIVDMGRSVLSGADSTWAVSWSLAGRPGQPLNYLGCVAQEAAYRLANGTSTGPRLVSLLGALLAATTLLGWLLQRGAKPWIALLAGLLLVMDPLFAASFRGARVDGMVFTCIFACCWMIRRGVEPSASGSRSLLTWPAAGMFLALAGLCWASAILLVPLVVYEFIDSQRSQVAGGGFKRFLRDGLLVALGAAATFALGLVPIWSTLKTSVQDTSSAVSAVASTGFYLERLVQAATCYKLSPWVILLGVLAMLRLDGVLFLGAFFLALFGVLSTRVYEHRALYLLPYLLLAIGSRADALAGAKNSRPGLAKASLCVLSLMVAWSAALTLGMRTWNAARQSRVRSYERVEEMASHASIQAGASVYCLGWEFYYVGRALGWKQYHYLCGAREGHASDYSHFLSRMDYVLMPENYANRSAVEELLKAEGFSFIRLLGTQTATASPGSSKPVIRVGAQGYPQCRLYANKARVRN